MSRKYRFFMLPVVTIGMLIAGGWMVKTPGISHDAGSSASSNSCVLPQGMSAEPLAKGDSDIELAWSEFEQLTHAKTPWLGEHRSVGSQPDGKDPVWTGWADKSDVNLETCISLDKAKWKASGLPNELRGLHVPVQQQILSASMTKMQVGIKSGVSAKPGDTLQHELAVVLFGPLAAKSVLKLSDGAKLSNDANSSSAQTGMPMESSSAMPDNGTIIKLVWEYVAPEVKTYSQVIFYDQDTILPASGTDKLDFMGIWPSRYSISAIKDENDRKKAESTPCDEKLPTKSMNGTSEVQLNCFYHYVFNSEPQEAQSVLESIKNELQPGGHPGKDGAMLLLVGAHVMVFNQKHKLWQWMTFYWTPRDNGRGWAKPWNHFQMKTTSAPSEPTVAHPSKVEPYHQIANPYLEGQTDGMSTNCVSCHSLAVYSPKGSRAGTGIFLAQSNKQPLVLPGSAAYSGKASYPATEFAAQKCGYFKGAVRAHFIWSLANTGALPSDPTIQACLNQ